MLADQSGYCIKFDIYTGKTKNTEKGLAFGVVSHLTSNLKNKNHILYFDNFFNSVQLLQSLKSKGINAVGTLNVNRKYLPSFKTDKNINRGESQWFTSDTGLAAIKWKDKRSVHLLSNFHDPKIVQEVNRKEKTLLKYLVRKPYLITILI